MLTNKNLSILLITAAIALATALQIRGQDSEQERRRKESYTQFPIAYYNASEEADPKKRAERILKNKRYDKGRMVVSDK